MAMYVGLMPNQVRTSSEDSKVVKSYSNNYEAAHIVVDHHNVGGGLTVTVYGKDDSSGYEYSLLSTNIVASGHTVMKIGPQYTAATNVAKEYIPYQFFVRVTASGTNAYGIGASVI